MDYELFSVNARTFLISHSSRMHILYDQRSATHVAWSLIELFLFILKQHIHTHTRWSEQTIYILYADTRQISISSIII